jgi:hypothetical protein
MAYTLSTVVLTEILEATNFTRTVNVIVDGFDPPISSIGVTKAADVNGNIVITTELTPSSNSFTISGQYNNNFTQAIKFLDSNKQENTITSKTAFGQLPAGYFMMVEYLASSSTSFIASYQVSVNGNLIGTVTQQVNNNYTPGRDALIAAVAGGQV